MILSNHQDIELTDLKKEPVDPRTTIESTPVPGYTIEKKEVLYHLKKTSVFVLFITLTSLYQGQPKKSWAYPIEITRQEAMEFIEEQRQVKEEEKERIREEKKELKRQKAREYYQTYKEKHPDKFIKKTTTPKQKIPRQKMTPEEKREKRRLYYETHKDKILERQRNYNNKIKEKRKEYLKDYYNQHKSYWQERYQKNKEKNREYNKQKAREYYLAHKEYWKERYKK